ncbi:MAG: SPFH domain-containing protein [Planctomycetota bacterium]
MDDAHHEHHGPHEGHPGEARPPEPVAHDPAARSLADALRMSFRLLTVVLAGVVIGFLLSGVSCIDPTEVGVVRVFDRIDHEVDEGLAYNFPFPIGRIDEVDTSNRTFPVERFWMHETPAEKGKPLDERRPPREGLRPGRDGYLLTGDRNILHVKLTVTYVVSDAVEFQTGAADPEDLLSSELCNAAIHAAAHRTAAGLQGTGAILQQFVEEVQRRTNERLTALGSGLRVVRIDVGNNITWPLGALAAFRAVQNATSEYERMVQTARQDATSTLRSAAGENYKALVGELEYVIGSKPRDGEAPSGAAAATTRPGGAPAGLIDRYRVVRQRAETLRAEAEAGVGEDAEALARQAGEMQARADELLRRIYAMLTAPATGGEASSIIARARAEREEKIQAVRARAERFAKLLPKFRDPEISWQVVQREWFQTRDKIMGYPMFETIRLTPGQKVIWRVGQDPSIAGEMELEQLRRRERQAGGGERSPDRQ